jgi:hypothetical protein
MYELSVAPDKGLFIFSPIFIIAIIGIFIELKKHRTEATWLLILIITNLVLYSSFNDPWGGWAFGPRYMVPAMAWLSLFVGSAASRFSRNMLWKMVVWALFVVSLAFSLAGTLTTNLLPPKVEAVYLKMDYGLVVNLKSLLTNKTFSLAYNSYGQTQFTLLHYYFAIVGVVAAFGLILIVICPYLEKREA